MTAPTPGEPNDSTGPVVVIRVCGRTYRLDADTFTTWQVRELAACITRRTGKQYSGVVADVIDAYLIALDERPAEAAA